MGIKYVKDFSFPASGGFHVQRFAKGGHVTKVPAKAKASAKGVPAKAKPNAPARDMKRKRYEDGGSVLKKIPPPSGREPMATTPLLVEPMAPENKFGGTPVGKGPAYGGDPMPTEPRYYALPVESAPLSPPPQTFGPAFDVESEEQTLARLAAERDMRRQNRMDIMGGRGEPGGRRMPMGALQAAAPVVAAPAMRVRERNVYAKGGKVEKVMGEYKRGELRSGSKKGPLVKSRKQAVAIAMSEAGKSRGKPVKKGSGGGVPAHRAKPMYGGGKC